MFLDVIEYTKKKILEAPIETNPYTYIEIDNFWPEDFYNLLLQNRITNDCLFTLKELDRVKTAYSDNRLVLELSSKITILSSDVRKFWEEVYNYLGNSVQKMLLEKFSIDVPNKKFEILYTRDSKNYQIYPHTDRANKILTALFYLPQTDDNSELGTVIFTPKNKELTNSNGSHFPFEDFDIHKIIPYKRNKLFCFVKSDISFHGVHPVTIDVDRDLLIFDIQKC